MDRLDNTGEPKPRSAAADGRGTSTRRGLRAGDIGRLDKVIWAGNIILDVKNVRVWVEGEPVRLRLGEFGLLAALASRPGELLTREKLAEQIWDSADARSSCTIDVHVQRVRTALAERSSFNYVQTVRGFGYRFAQAGAHPRNTARRLRAAGNGR